MRNSFAIACGCMIGLASVGTTARADIYQWEYINAADPDQGKRQSTTLAPQGAGVDATPGAHLFGRDLTMAYLIGADLRNAYMHWVNLTEADLSRANLSDAALGDDLFGSTLTNANFTDAQVHGADLFSTGFTADQLYSTASYKARDLRRIRIDSDLVGVNLAGQNLTAADFGRADLTGANFRQAILTNAAFSAQYYNCGHTNSLCMPSTSPRSATLTDADFTEAEVRGANFNRSSASDGTGITLAQLYSTASYQAGDLSGIGLSENILTGGNFADQNLAHAHFGIAMLAGANFRGANLANASFQKTQFVPCLFGLCDLWFVYTENAVLIDVDLTGADARGAMGLNVADATTANLIQPDGRVDRLNLDAGELLVVRDYDGDPARIDSNSFLPNPMPPIAITVDQHLTIAPGGTLRMVFEADAWDSTISFAPGIPVALGGTLELTFVDDVNIAAQLGRTLQIFDWTGVSPTGAFNIASPYRWDISNLYTTGEITLTAVPEPASFVLLMVAVLLILGSPRTRCALAIPVLVVAVSPAYADLPMTGTYVPELQEVDALLENFMVGKPIPGGTITITHNDKVVYERGIGYSNDARTIPMQETALMRLASVSKPITASAIQQLAKDGQIHLNDKVFNIDGNGGILNVTPYNGTLGDSRLRDITLQHLLEHKGGWNREIAGDMAFEDVQIAATMGVPNPPGIDNSARYIVSQPLQFTPGSAEYYSNIGYMFLGMVVEAASGQAYEDYVDNHVLAPAGIPVWEVDAGRTFSVDQNPREPVYSDPATFPNVFDPVGPLVPVPYGGWDHEKALAFGGLIASSKAIALLAQNRIANGPEIGKLRSESTTNPQNIGGHLGVLPGTLTLMVQESSKDWTYSILFDGLPADWSSSAFSLFDSLNQTLDGLTTWPEAILYAGDFTSDQWLTLDDVTFFKQALTLGSEAAFTSAFPTARYAAGDFNNDGQVSVSDAVGFIHALRYGGVPAEYVALVPGFFGDFNLDGGVDAADYTVWRNGLGSTYSMDDYDVWKAHFGQSFGAGGGLDLVTGSPSPAIPEPAAAILVLLALVCGLANLRRAHFRQ